MATEEPKAPESGRWQFSLRTLLIIHVIAILVACGVAGPGSPTRAIANLIFVTLLCGQMCLLGVWLALGTNSGRCRVAGALTGIAFLTTSVAYNTWLNNSGRVSIGMMLPVLLPMVSSPTLGVAAVLLVVRCWRAHLVAHGSDLPEAAAEGLQFSIRHLLLLTTAVAVLLIIAKGGGLLMNNTPWLQTAGIIGMATLCFIAITLAAVWAGLGVSRPTERIVVVMLLALFTGVLVAYVLTFDEMNEMSWQKMWGLPTGTVVTAAVVMASLLVVRSNGYRLVRRSP